MEKSAEKLGESLEDYAEAILELEEKEGSARVTGVSKKLSVSKPSVSEALALLKKRGVITHAPYSTIRLTEKGKRLAKKVRWRHEILSGFLTDILGIQREKADVQACRMEHVLEPETIEKLCRLGAFLKISFKNPALEVSVKLRADAIKRTESSGKRNRK